MQRSKIRLRRGFSGVSMLAVGMGFAAAAIAICPTPSTGPDVIVGSLYNLGDGYTGATGTGGIQAYAVGTRSLNIGDEDLEWFASVNRHPVIGQQMYRLKTDFERPVGRLEMVGMSWLKHGFTALAETQFCGGSCTFESGHGSGSYLGMGCADPYTSSLNGQQSRLGPRGQVNAFTGYYPFDSTHEVGTGDDAIRKRLQVADTDMDPALNTGARYFVEGQYVTYDDATSGNGFNNSSYREVVVDASRNLEFAADSVNNCPWDLSADTPTLTHCMLPAIFAWQAIDPLVEIATVDVPSEGRFHAARRTFDNGDGTWHYEYAIHNLNSDRSARAFTVDFPAATGITDQGFYAVPHHSGDCLEMSPPDPGNNACGTAIATADWTIQVDAGAGAIAWFTDEFAVVPEANALRWGTMFNFWFDADRSPSQLSHTLTLFKPGSPSLVAFDFVLFADGFESSNTSAWSSTVP